MTILENLLYLYSLLLLLALAILDLRTRMVPNYLTLGGYPIFIALLLANTLQVDGVEANHLIRAGLGALSLFIFFTIPRIARPDSIGMGDLKIAPLFGAILAWSSWHDFGIGLAICFFANGLVALGLLLSRRADRKSHLPLIPFMLLGLSVVAIPILT